MNCGHMHAVYFVVGTLVAAVICWMFCGTGGDGG